jgi:hypothetical protein
MLPAPGAVSLLVLLKYVDLVELSTDCLDTWLSNSIFLHLQDMVPKSVNGTLSSFIVFNFGSLKLSVSVQLSL